MANREHLRILRLGVPEWNQWRTNNPTIRPDLRQAELACLDLREADFHAADLCGANLSRANLARACFRDADLRKANLAQSELSHGNFIGANLENGDLHAADLRGGEFLYSVLRDANLVEADLNGAAFFMADLHGTDLSFALGLTQSQINTANGNSRTKLPAELRMPAQWQDRAPARLLWRSRAA